MDILTKLAKETSKPVKVMLRVRRFQIGWGTYQETRFGKKLHTYVKARKIVSRLKKRGVDAWICGPLMVWKEA